MLMPSLAAQTPACAPADETVFTFDGAATLDAGAGEAKAGTEPVRLVVFLGGGFCFIDG